MGTSKNNLTKNCRFWKSKG